MPKADGGKQVRAFLETSYRESSHAQIEVSESQVISTSKDVQSGAAVTEVTDKYDIRAAMQGVPVSCLAFQILRDGGC